MERAHSTVVALVLALGIIRSAPAHAQARTPAAIEKAVVAAERALWEMLKRGEYSEYDKAISGVTTIDAGGIAVWKSGRPQELEALVTRSYALDSVRTRELAPGIVLLTYMVRVDQTDHGKKTPSPVYAMSLWQRKNGKWVPIAHAESLAAGAQAGSS